MDDAEGYTMDGLHLVAAADVTWTIGEREYRLSPLRLADYAEMERHIVAARSDPLELVRGKLAELPEPLQRHLLSAAYDDLRRGPRVTLAELADWMDTLAGQAFTFWLAVRRNHPHIGRDEALALFDQARGERADMRRRLNEVCGAPPGN
jgi:hypothetical protein